MQLYVVVRPFDCITKYILHESWLVKSRFQKENKERNYTFGYYRPSLKLKSRSILRKISQVKKVFDESKSGFYKFIMMKKYGNFTLNSDFFYTNFYFLFLATLKDAEEGIKKIRNVYKESKLGPFKTEQEFESISEGKGSKKKN